MFTMMGINAKKLVISSMFGGELRKKQKAFNSHIKILRIRITLCSIIIIHKYKC